MQLALERGEALLDMVAGGAVGENGQPLTYDSVRKGLAAAYREAGLLDVANFLDH